MKKFLLSFLCLMTLFAANAAVIGDTYTKVKSVSDLTIDAEYILCYETYAMGAQNGTKYRNCVANGITLDNDNATIASTDVVPFTIVAGTAADTYAFKFDTGYLECTNITNGSVKESTTLAETCNLSISINNGTATIIPTKNSNSNNNKIQCNKAAGQERFTNYKTGKQKNCTLYKKVNVGPVDYTPGFQDVELMAGDTHTLALGDKHPADMIFASGNDNVATVTDEGVITAVAEGTATITCSWDADSNFNAGETEFTVTVTPKVKVVYAPDFQNVTITEGSTLALALGEKHPEIVFDSSDENVATIDNAGVITALAVGETTISCLWGDADYEDGDAEFTVTVEKAPVVTDVTIVMKDVHGTTGNNALGEFTAKDITFIPAKNNGGTAPAYNNTAGDVRIYAKGSLEIKSTRNIVKIVFNISTAGLKRLAPITANVGTVAAQALGDVTVTWTGDANDIKFTVGDKANYGSDGSSRAGQFNFDSVVITYAPEAPECPYTEEELTPIYSVGTVTFDENNQAKIEIPNNDLDGVKIYYKHEPSAASQASLMSVDHADFTEAAHNVENGTHDFTINGAGQVTYYGYHEATDTKGVERTFKVLENGTTGVEGVEVDSDDAAVEYFNLQGVRVENPAAGGLYIRKQGSKVTKVIL